MAPSPTGDSFLTTFWGRGLAALGDTALQSQGPSSGSGAGFGSGKSGQVVGRSADWGRGRARMRVLSWRAQWPAGLQWQEAMGSSLTFPRGVPQKRFGFWDQQGPPPGCPLGAPVCRRGGGCQLSSWNGSKQGSSLFCSENERATATHNQDGRHIQRGREGSRQRAV